MDTLDRHTLLSLARFGVRPCVSIYLPTHRAGSEKEQDRLRYRNLLKAADAELRTTGMRSPDASQFLGRATELLEDASFWRQSADGLAVFVSEGETTALRLDISFSELLAVDERFVIRPLLPALRSNDKFWLLALSKNRVRLFEADYTEVREVPLTDAPASIEDAMKYEDPDHGLQFHSGTPAAPGHARRSAVFHGHGGAPDVEKEHLVRYLRLVDRGMRPILGNSSAPLLIAAVDTVAATYRDVCSYPYVAPGFLAGNPDELTPERLHADARELLAPHFRAQRDADLAELETLSGTSAVSADPVEIVPAAHEGRIRTLFVTEHRSLWGAYDPSSRHVDLHDEPVNGDRDLTELAVAETLLHGGDVHVVAADSAFSAPAALLRY